MSTLPPHISVVTFTSLSGVVLEEHGVTDDLLLVLREMFEDVRVLSTDRCGCSFCLSERWRYQVEPASEAR